jgi:hypothetical protein
MRNHTLFANSPDSANPAYLNYLATQQLLADPAFIAYLDYLQYFTRPEYVKFLMCVVSPTIPFPLPLGRACSR